MPRVLASAASESRPQIRRWLTVVLRTLHLVGVVLAAIGVVGGGAHSPAGFALMLASGIALFATDLWHRPSHWRELAGAFVLLKLALVAAMVLWPAVAAPLFWTLLVASSVVSHAPRAARHSRILGKA